MVNLVLDGVAEALYEAYPDIMIYSEHIPQGFIKPCFFIEAIEPSQAQELDDCFRLVVPLRIHYFGVSERGEGLRSEAHGVAMVLYGALLYIDADGRKRGTSMSHRLSVDCTLLFDVTYTVRFKRGETVPDMQTLEQGLGVNVND